MSQGNALPLKNTPQRGWGSPEPRPVEGPSGASRQGAGPPLRSAVARTEQKGVLQLRDLNISVKILVSLELPARGTGQEALGALGSEAVRNLAHC